MPYIDLQAPNGMLVKVDSSKKKKIKALLDDGFVDVNAKPKKKVIKKK